MLFSRWKVMTGLIGISVGGLAALAGQTPKPDGVASPPIAPHAPQRRGAGQGVQPVGCRVVKKQQ